MSTQTGQGRGVAKRLSVALLGLMSLPAAANPFFGTFNQGAFSRSFLLPALGEPELLAPGAERSAWTLDLTNDYHTASEGGESITLDGETTRLAWRYARGGEDSEWSLELPLYHQGGGFMDSFIERWHGWFGLPNGGREQAPQDRYLFQVTRGATVVYRNTETGAALGDLRLSAGWQWTETIALRAAVQLPTGDEDLLAGGNAGLAAWADSALPFAQSSAWSGFASLGVTLAQRSEVLADLQKREALFGGFGLSYAWTPALSFTAQLYAHTPLYQDTDLGALKRPGLQAAFGGSYALSEKLLLRLGVQEDPVTTSSPDFSVHAALVFH